MRSRVVTVAGRRVRLWCSETGSIWVSDRADLPGLAERERLGLPGLGSDGFFERKHRERGRTTSPTRPRGTTP